MQYITWVNTYFMANTLWAENGRFWVHKKCIFQRTKH